MFINFVLFPPSYMPDQYVYVNEVNSLRAGNAEFGINFDLDTLKRFRVQAAAIIYSLIPLPSFLGINAIAFANKFLVLILACFLFSRIGTRYTLIFLLVPSLILYSSVSLRETLIVTFTIFGLLLIIEKRFLLSLVFLAVITILKFQNLPSLIFIWSSMLLYKYLNNYLALVIPILIFGLFFFLFQDFLITQLFFYKTAFMLESGINSEDLLTTEVNTLQEFIASPPSTLAFIQSLILSFIMSLIRPIPYELSLFTLLSFSENIILFILIFFFIKTAFEEKTNVIPILIFILGSSIALSIHGYTIFNDGTFSRYKFGVIFPLLVSMYYLVNLKKNNS